MRTPPLLILLIVVIAAAVTGAQSQEGFRFKSGVEFVNVTATVTDGNGRFKPGLDFYNSGGQQGQALMLQNFAATHNVKMVVVSIGGNDFNFGDIVQTCVTDFLSSPTWFKDYCNDDSSVTSNFTTAS